MTRDREQLAAAEWFRATVHAIAPRLRVVTDAEGWPVVRGRYGQIEWAGDEKSVAIYCDAVRLFRPLLAIPGIRRHQMGDEEIRVLLPVDRSDFGPAFIAAASLMRARRRRILTEGQKAVLDHGRRLFQPRVAP